MVIVIFHSFLLCFFCKFFGGIEAIYLSSFIIPPKKYRPYEWPRELVGVVLAYDALIRETHAQFKVMVESRGIDVIFTPEDPYQTPEDLFKDLDVKVLRVFTGGTLPEGHPMRRPGRPSNRCATNRARCIYALHL